MTARAYLKQIARMQMQLPVLLETIQIDDSALDVLMSSRAKSQIQRDRDRRMRDVAALRAEIDKRIDMIQQLSRPEYAEVLRRKYVDGQTIKQAAAAMFYCNATVERFHTAALKEFTDRFRSILDTTE